MFGGKLFGLRDGYTELSFPMKSEVAHTKYFARVMIDELDTTAFHTQWRKDEFEELAYMLYEYRDSVQVFTAMNQTFEEWRQKYDGDNTYWKLFNPKQTLCISMRTN
jgi:hypothetical protein